MNDKFILNGDQVVPEPDLLAWARWFETADRRVALTEVSPRLRVSTVFLGLDHSFGDGPPLIFETMTFGPEGEVKNGFARYSTLEEAKRGHDDIVRRMRRQ